MSPDASLAPTFISFSSASSYGDMVSISLVELILLVVFELDPEVLDAVVFELEGVLFMVTFDAIGAD